MTRFEDGPAAGVSLELERCPIYLRVVVDQEGKVDALDQLDDVAAPDETIFAYRKVGEDGIMHVDSVDRKTGRRVGRSYKLGTYRLLPEQPDDATLRDRELWGAWAQAAHDAGRAAPEGAP